jgi:hypothetical protein
MSLKVLIGRVLLICLLSSVAARAATISNLVYRVDSTSSNSVVVTEVATGATATFHPNFRIMYSATSPGYQMYDVDVKVTEYGVAGFYPNLWNSDPDFFNAAGTNYTLSASTNLLETNTLRWVFTGTNGIGLDARISVPAGSGAPLLGFTLTTASAGYYTVGYVGAPERTTSQVDWMWQPVLWTGKRYPSTSYLTAETQCTLPAVINGYSNQAVGLAVDPASVYSPYNDPEKDLLDSASGQPGNYGVVLRNEAGRLQPMVFTPVYGRSSLGAATKVSLGVRLFVRQGDWYANYKHLASTLYGFADYRTNALCSLNTTLDNMQDFIQGPYGHWLPRYKAWDYVNDKPGWGRQQSAADAISLAIVKDDLALFTNISRPTLEYMLSRTGSLFPQSNTNDPPSSAMGGWIGSAYGGCDLAAAYQLSGKRSTVVYQKLQPTLRTTALTGSGNLGVMKDAMGELLSNYRITGNVAYLNAARTTATNYIALRLNQRPTGAADAEGGFFFHLGPGWYLMNEMYDETGDPVYRDAFVRGLQEFSAFNFLIPRSGPTNITVQNYLTGGNDSVPSWRVDPRGLMRETVATMHSHAGIFMPPFASYMLRAAQYTNDSFLQAIGRSAVVGRYANYPGYAYRKRLTASFEKEDWPLQNYSVIRNYITMHFNHPLSMTTYLLEYLVADASARSGEQIKFPSTFSWTGGGYFMHKVYGIAPGVFHSDTNVFLWLPQDLVTNSSVQVNYLSGYGNGNFYLALMNQSSNTVTAQIGINSSRVNLAGNHGVRLIADNVGQPTTNIQNGVMTVTVSGMGITALVISNASVTTTLQALCYEPNPVPLPTSCWQTQTATPVGDVGGQLLSFGRRLTSAFVWVDYDTNNLTQATLRYETNGVWNSLLKTQFPFEFTVPLPDNQTSFRFYVEGRTPAGTTVSNTPLQLGYQLTIQSPTGPGSPTGGGLYNYNQAITTNVPFIVTSNASRYVCSGWTMSGNAPFSGTTNKVSFSLTNDAVLTWQWQTIPLPEVTNTNGASGITTSNALLNGTLISTGRAPTSVSFCWGPADGATNRAAWIFSTNLGPLSPGALTVPIGGLLPSTPYFYRAVVTNIDGEFWASSSASFVSASTNAGGGGVSAGYKMKFGFSAYNRPETLTNFPALIVLGTNLAANGFSYTQFLSAAGYDLRFTDASQSVFLNYEISRWNTNGKSYVWVQLPQLSSNTFIWAFWGIPTNSAPYSSLTDGSTWSEGYAAVWHFGETPGTGNVVLDSTANQRHGVASNLLASDQVPGLAGGSLNFDGATKFIQLNSSLVVAASNAFTLSAWVRPAGTTPFPGITAPATSPGFNDSLRLYSDAKPRFNISGGNRLFNSVTPKDGNTWTHLAVTRADGSPGSFGLYQNGTNDAATPAPTTAAFPIAYLGRGMETNDVGRNWNGGLAEIRVSLVERSANWVWAEWFNVAANQQFVQTFAVTTNQTAPILLSGRINGTALVLAWPSVTNWTYDVEQSTNLPGGFLPILTNLPATPPQNVVSNSLPALPKAFFRVRGSAGD